MCRIMSSASRTTDVTAGGTDELLVGGCEDVAMSSDDRVQRVSDAGELYSLPQEQFTAARDLLAHSLRSDGRNEEANDVSRLRKPSVVAWALNRTARSHPGLVERLRESHRLLREATSMEAVRSASEERQAAISALVEVSMGELTADGRTVSPQTRDRINATLLAVATDPDGEARLAAGELVKELEPSGVGWDAMGLAPIPVDPRKEALAVANRARARADRTEREVKEAERRLEAAERAVDEARRKLETARERYEQANKEAKVAAKAAE